eukprot:5688031-Prymnesium_polylepis.1
MLARGARAASLEVLHLVHLVVLPRVVFLLHVELHLRVLDHEPQQVARPGQRRPPEARKSRQLLSRRAAD